MTICKSMVAAMKNVQIFMPVYNLGHNTSKNINIALNNNNNNNNNKNNNNKNKNNNNNMHSVIRSHLGSGSDTQARKHPVTVARLTDQMT